MLNLDQLLSMVFDGSRERPLPLALIDVCSTAIAEVRRNLAAEFVARMENEGASDIPEDVARAIACAMPGWWAPAHDILLRCDASFRHPMIFLGADDATRSSIIRRREEEERNGHLLSCLAWIGDAEVCRLLDRWRREPPAWAVPAPDRLWMYCYEAGWELTESASRRDLFSRECYALIPSSGDSDAISGPVEVITPHEGACGFCGRQLTSLFGFDLKDQRLSWLGMAGDRLRLAMCDRCTGWSPTFTEVDGQGKSRWHACNEKPSYIGPDDGWERLPLRRLMLGRQRVSPYEANVSIFEHGISQVGGHPTWINGADYPQCPSCRRAMKFVGQLLTEDLQVEEIVEGITYAFLCAGCGTAAMCYQQT